MPTRKTKSSFNYKMLIMRTNLSITWTTTLIKKQSYKINWMQTQYSMMICLLPRFPIKPLIIRRLDFEIFGKLKNLCIKE